MVEQSDADFIQQAYAKPELRSSLGREPMAFADIKQKIEDDTQNEKNQHFLICLKEGLTDSSERSQTTPIGLFTARNIKQRPNLAIWIEPEYHGKGFGKEAATLAIELIFRTYDVPSIGAGVYEFNKASQALLESLGFKHEGRQRKYHFYDGRYHDNLKYGILREEWEQRNRE